MASSFSFRAGGNITPCRFVMQDGSNQFQVLQADGTGPILGVSQEGTRKAGGTAADDGYAAIAGGQLKVYGDSAHDDVLVEAGAAITALTPVVADSVGRAVAWNSATATNQFVGGIALENATGAGKFVRVIVRPQIVGHTA